MTSAAAWPASIRQTLAEVHQRVAVLGEHDGRIRARAEADGRARRTSTRAATPCARWRPAAVSIRRSASRVRQPQIRRPRRRLVRGDELAVGIAERKRELIGCPRHPRRRERRQPALDRLRQRPGARQRALVQHGQREAYVTLAIVSTLAANGVAVASQQGVHAPLGCALADLRRCARAGSCRCRHRAASGGTRAAAGRPASRPPRVPHSDSNARRSPL